MGTVNVDMPLADKLIKENKIFSFGTDAHKSEHSLEVELPFLQYVMKTDYKIVPIIIGAQSASICKEIAKALKPYLNPDNLFIISSDFSHYPSYKDATVNDELTANAIVSNSPASLLNTIRQNDLKEIPNLATSLCGWTSVLTLLYMTENNPDFTFNKILYKNSGDSEYGDKTNVVGYYSIAVSEKQTLKTETSLFNFTAQDKKDLLAIARRTINTYIRENKYPKFNTESFSPNIKQHFGAFVTLHEKGQLRGCIGRFTADIPLYEVVRDMAIASSTEDTRFEPLAKDEIDDIEIEISVLSPMKKIVSVDEIILGKHGIYIKKGSMGGTFLPQVATETKWTKEEFLGHCARDKAGIGWTGWKDRDTEIFTYEAEIFSEKDFL
jgi:AmmeMemoRadiSam system protein A